MTLLEQFAADWAVMGFKVEYGRIRGVYGFIEEYNGKLWVWTHSHSPNGHEFFPMEGFCWGICSSLKFGWEAWIRPLQIQESHRTEEILAFSST